MSSGSETTVGPGRPDNATRKAAATAVGICSGSSTSVTDFAMPP